MKKKIFVLKPVEKYLINQFANPHTIRGVQWVKRIIQGVPALRNRDCRRFFFGQLISNIGSWMQIVALGWLVYNLTQSAFWVGVVAAAGAISALVFSLFGGTIVDRFPKKQVLLLTHITAAIVAFLLGFLALTHHLTLPLIIFFSFIGGLINSIYTPAHYSFISELVDKDSISSAISINAAVSSLGRVLGPALAGIYIKIAGAGGAFIINGISYLAVIFALILIKKKSQVINNHLKPLEAIKAGLVYSYNNPMIRSTLLYIAANSIFAMSYVTIIPVVAEEIFHSGSVGMGNLHTAVGLGAITATVFCAYLSHRLSKLTLFSLGNTIFAISLFLFTFITSLNLGLLVIFLAGFGLTVVTIILSVMAQALATPEYRGRISSIYFMLIGGIAFIGNLEIGYLTEVFGPQIALRLNTIIMLIIGIYIFFIKDSLRQKQKIYNQFPSI